MLPVLPFLMFVKFSFLQKGFVGEDFPKWTLAFTSLLSSNMGNSATWCIIGVTAAHLVEQLSTNTRFRGLIPPSYLLGCSWTLHSEGLKVKNMSYIHSRQWINAFQSSISIFVPCICHCSHSLWVSSHSWWMASSQLPAAGAYSAIDWRLIQWTAATDVITKSELLGGNSGASPKPRGKLLWMIISKATISHLQPSGGLEAVSNN